MKFSELDTNQWSDLQPYLDTCLLPVTGLTGKETPPEATDRIAAAGEWLAPLEIAFRGRTVTLPAYHYCDAADTAETARLQAYCEHLKRTGFRFLIIVTGAREWPEGAVAAADLTVGPGTEGAAPDADAIRKAVTDLWKMAASGAAAE